MDGRLPDYDPAKDGNRFQWIIEQSKRVRAERQAIAASRRLFTQIDRRLMAEHDAAIEAEDGQRLQNLRAQYNPARSRNTKKVA